MKNVGFFVKEVMAFVLLLGICFGGCAWLVKESKQAAVCALPTPQTFADAIECAKACQGDAELCCIALSEVKSFLACEFKAHQAGHSDPNCPFEVAKAK